MLVFSMKLQEVQIWMEEKNCKKYFFADFCFGKPGATIFRGNKIAYEIQLKLTLESGHDL